jgi:hypothetical protein
MWTISRKMQPDRAACTAVAVRNDNPMPYAPGNLAEANLLLETLSRDWTEELLKERPDWEYLDNLNDWIEETWDVIVYFELDEDLSRGL